MKGEANLDSPVQWITRSALEDGSWGEKVEFLIPSLCWIWPCRCFSSIWRQNITGEYKDFHASDLIATLYYGLGNNSTIVNTTKRTASRWWALDYAAAQAETYVQLSGKSSLLLPLCMLYVFSRLRVWFRLSITAAYLYMLWNKLEAAVLSKENYLNLGKHWYHSPTQEIIYLVLVRVCNNWEPLY